MLKTISFGLLMLLLASCTSKNEQSKTAIAIKDSLTSELNEVHKQGNFNGFSVAIVNEEGTLYQQGIGYANIKDKQKYTDSTIQNIGSVSKTFIGIALLKAQELGKLKLDDPINKYLPFEVNNPFYPNVPITIRHLTTHTSTIGDNEFYLKRNYFLKPNQDIKNTVLFLEDEQAINTADSAIAMKDFLQNVLSTKGKWYKKEDFLKQQPGDIFEYTNVGAALAAYIIELATGQSFNTFTAKHILQPLQMNASGWKFDEIDFSKHAHLYQTPDTALPFYALATYPDGNFITSSNDLAKYLTELMKGYSGNGTILSKESYQEYFKVQLTAKNYVKRNGKNPYSDEYNVGVFIGFSVAGNIGHTGGDPGVASMMFFNPKTKIGRVLIVNTNINNKAGNDEFYAIWNTLEKYQQKF
jgi:CubicO group peptidase (beta-lactamase class C family)